MFAVLYLYNLSKHDSANKLVLKDETKLLREHMKVTDTLCETSESVSRTHDGVRGDRKCFQDGYFFI